MRARIIGFARMQHSYVFRAARARCRLRCARVFCGFALAGVICAPVRARVRCGKAADMSRGAQPVARAAAQSVVRPLSAELHDSHVAVSWRVRRPRPRSPLRIPAAIAGWRHTARGPSGRTVQLSMSGAALAAADGANALRTVRLRRRAYLQRAGRAVWRWLPAVNVKFRYNGVRRRQNRPARPHDAAIAFDLHGDVW